MNRKIFLTLLLLLNFVQFLNAQNQAGMPDMTFGTNGEVVTPLQSYESFNDLVDMALQADGKIVALGTTVYRSIPPSDPGKNGVRFLLVRYNADGSLDMTFGDEGKSSISMGSEITARSIVIQPDDRILVAGDGVTDQFPRNIVVARYDPDGSLEATFGTRGVVFTHLSEFGELSSDQANNILLQPDGKIIVAGMSGSATKFALVRYNADGQLDLSFGAAGKVFASIAPGYHTLSSAALQNDGKILIGGVFTIPGAPTVSVVGRFNNNGRLDTDFCGSGFCEYNDLLPKVRQLPDQKILVASVGLLYRHQTKGEMDAEFLFAPTQVNGYGQIIKDVDLQPDGKIVMVTMIGELFTREIALTRYLPDGQLDTSFGTNGSIVRTNQFSTDGRRVLIQPDGKILIGFQLWVTAGPSAGYLCLARYLGDAPSALELETKSKKIPTN